MAMSSEKRSEFPLCNAKKKSGERCRAFAGQGTSHLGIGRCKFHLGSTRSHVSNATVQEAQRRMVKFGAPIEIHPQEALLAMLHLSSGHTAWLREEIAKMESLDSFESQVIVNLYNDERDRLARVARSCLDAGIAERMVLAAERYGVAVAGVLRAIFDDGDLGLTVGQRDRLPTLVRRHLGSLEQGSVLAGAA